jgi:hypothetical protein
MFLCPGENLDVPSSSLADDRIVDDIRATGNARPTPATCEGEGARLPKGASVRTERRR